MSGYDGTGPKLRAQYVRGLSTLVFLMIQPYDPTMNEQEEHTTIDENGVTGPITGTAATQEKYDVGQHPASIIALRANGFKPGFDPRRNTKGRPAAGLTLTEAYNELADAEKYPDAEIDRIGKEHPNRAWRAAADLWARVRDNKEEFSKSGNPLVSQDLDRIHDRTVGRAKQQIQVEQRVIEDPQALMLQAAALVAEHPQLSRLFEQRAALSDAESVEGPPQGPQTASG